MLIRWLETLTPFVPLLQTMIWVLVIGIVCFVFRKPGKTILDLILLRIGKGSSFKAGPIELGQDVQQLGYVKPGNHGLVPPKTPSQVSGPVDWSGERTALYKQSRGVFLAHLLQPSPEAGQSYDIFIFLVRHKSKDFSDIKCAEFFFGHYWGNEVFREMPRDGLIGVSTSAYGPFLCTCRVSFRDGHIALIHRYIDFEMGRVFHRDTQS